jgi:hypothetical protein
MWPPRPGHPKKANNERFNIMKTRIHHELGRSALSLSPPVLALGLLLATLPTHAASSFTGTAWLTGVPVPGILSTNGSGQVYLKGNVHTLRLLADDARVTGRLEAMPDVAFQPDGTRQFTGTAYSEVGTWDAAGTNFTASGGVWDLHYRGVTQTDGSIHYDIVGYGIGGPIDGLRTEITADRGPGPTFDPSIPYAFSGTIKAAPVNSCVPVDDFNGPLAGWAPGAGSQTPVVSAAEGNLTINCDWTGVATANPVNTLAWAGHDRAWTVSDAQTVELRAELVALNPAADSATLAFAVQQGGPNYVLFKGHNWLMLLKQNGTAFAALCGARVVTPDTAAVMSLALTQVGQNLVVMGRVFDKAASNNVLGQLSYLDTPASDPVLSSEQIAELVGGTLQGFGPDPGPFLTTGQRVWVGVWQYTDGTKPAAEAVFDNVELRTYEVPTIGIQPALRLTWLAPSGVNYDVEAAPTPQGPWQPLSVPITDSEIPGMKQASVPANSTAQFFRLVQAP